MPAGIFGTYRLRLIQIIPDILCPTFMNIIVEDYMKAGHRPLVSVLIKREQYMHVYVSVTSDTPHSEK